MGRGMAANLVKKGHSVLVYDVTPEAVTDLGTEDYILNCSELDNTVVTET